MERTVTPLAVAHGRPPEWPARHLQPPAWPRHGRPGSKTLRLSKADSSSSMAETATGLSLGAHEGTLQEAECGAGRQQHQEPRRASDSSALPLLVRQKSILLGARTNLDPPPTLCREASHCPGAGRSLGFFQRTSLSPCQRLEERSTLPSGSSFMDCFARSEQPTCDNVRALPVCFPSASCKNRPGGSDCSQHLQVYRRVPAPPVPLDINLFVYQPSPRAYRKPTAACHRKARRKKKTGRTSQRSEPFLAPRHWEHVHDGREDHELLGQPGVGHLRRRQHRASHRSSLGGDLRVWRLPFEKNVSHVQVP